MLRLTEHVSCLETRLLSELIEVEGYDQDRWTVSIMNILKCRALYFSHFLALDSLESLQQIADG